MRHFTKTKIAFRPYGRPGARFVLETVIALEPHTPQLFGPPEPREGGGPITLKFAFKSL